MGGTIFSKIEEFGQMLSMGANIKGKSEEEYLANLKTAHMWGELNDRKNPASAPLQEFISRFNLNIKDTFLVAGLISHFYENQLIQLQEEFDKGFITDEESTTTDPTNI